MNQWLLVIGLLFTSSVTLAQEQQPNTNDFATVLPVGVLCGSREMIINPIIRSGEVLVAKNLTQFRTVDGEPLAAIGEIWINPETKSFSYVLSFPDSPNACYMFGGQEFTAAGTPGQPT
mgnify:FL=1